jgi:hypothetical protein
MSSERLAGRGRAAGWLWIGFCPTRWSSCPPGWTGHPFEEHPPLLLSSWGCPAWGLRLPPRHRDQAGWDQARGPLLSSTCQPPTSVTGTWSRQPFPLHAPPPLGTLGRGRGLRVELKQGAPRPCSPVRQPGLGVRTQHQKRRRGDVETPPAWVRLGSGTEIATPPPTSCTTEARQTECQLRTADS